ncbi:hypothetical protein AB4Z48_19175 [Cupriavidus sp. 2TAF22]|uniref:hypothetical protein n=1 Tax=unclassified Cupriavidus TaxID=2640874 RepID=UPI003F930A7A
MLKRHLIALAGVALLAGGLAPARAGGDRPQSGSIACSRADNMYCRVPPRPGAPPPRPGAARDRPAS